MEEETQGEKTGQALTRFPRPCRLRSVDLGITGLTSEFIPCEAFADDP